MPVSPSEIIPKLHRLLTTFSKETKEAALAKCQEHGFDVNRGTIPLEETLINLDSSVAALAEAIERGKLQQIPLSLQRRILKLVQEVEDSLSRLIGGSDEIINLTDAVEAISAEIWQSRLLELSDEILGFNRRLNEVKQLEVQANASIVKLNEGLSLKPELEQLIANAKSGGATIDSQVSAANASVAQILENAKEAQNTTETANALLAQIRQTDTTASESLSSAKASNGEIATLEQRIKTFFGEIDQSRQAIEALEAHAKETVSKNKASVQELIDQLGALESSIKIQIEKATGYSLFHSFQKRQETLQSSKQWWAIIVFVILAVSVGITIWIAKTTTSFDIAFYLKLSVSLPLIYAIAFSTVQYSRERKLEEEYAFKSNISISLDPYQTLVSRLLKPDDAAEQAKFTAFIIDSISKVFASPTERIFDGATKDANPKNLEKAIKVLGDLLRAIKPGA